MAKLSTITLNRIILGTTRAHPDTVYIYLDGAVQHFGRAWYGGSKQDADAIVDAWNKRDYALVRAMVRGNKYATGHGEDLCCAIAAHLAATTKPDDSASDENYALDVGAPDTWGIGNKPHAKVKQWEPDTPDPDVDLMKSIRDACAR